VVHVAHDARRFFVFFECGKQRKRNCFTAVEIADMEVKKSNLSPRVVSRTKGGITRALHARFKADFGGIMCQFGIRRRYQDVSNKKVKSDKPHARRVIAHLLSHWLLRFHSNAFCICGLLIKSHYSVMDESLCHCGVCI
jgi:hypothetical protein